LEHGGEKYSIRKCRRIPIFRLEKKVASSSKDKKKIKNEGYCAAM
jgi:hypothetical protein